MCDISGVVNNVFPIAVQRRSVWARGSTIAALLGLTLHAALALNAARRLSPTWDEIAAPASGLAQLQTGALTLNTVNPFLSRLFYALPLTVQGATLPWDHPAWRERDEYRFGFQYTFRNRVAPQRLIVASRLVAVLFSLGVGILLFLRTKAVWGPLGGAVAVWAYGATPILASRASIAMAEMPMYFFILLALAFHTRREKKRDAASLWATGLCAGLALLCKLAALPLLPLFFIWEWMRPGKKPRIVDRLADPLRFAGIAVAVFALSYLPWKNGLAALGMACDNLRRFDKIIPYYFHERVWTAGNTFLSWGAFAVKAPPAILGLAGLGAWGWWKSGADRPGWWRWTLFGGLVLGTVLFFDRPVSTVQLSPFYLSAVVLAAGVAGFPRSRRRHVSAAVIGLLGWAWVDIAEAHPNALGYFNGFAGGPDQGWRWLADSDHDWGQGLPLLAEHLRRDPPGTLLLAYSGSGDPEAYGLRYVDFFSPALVSWERRDDLSVSPRTPVVLAVATKLLQTNPELFETPLTRWTPRARVGHCFILWDLRSTDRIGWLHDQYVAMGRPVHARWTTRITPGDPKPNPGD
ncbi:MAG: glycosyltransferase family 39 protein [Elusimicrobia bacterium]|nr:glycosyltransferase family 39 protein [Elusimicrobiota bacterium]